MSKKERKKRKKKGRYLSGWNRSYTFSSNRIVQPSCMPVGTVFHERCKSMMLLLEFSAQCCVFELVGEAWMVSTVNQQLAAESDQGHAGHRF